MQDPAWPCICPAMLNSKNLRRSPYALLATATLIVRIIMRLPLMMMALHMR